MKPLVFRALIFSLLINLPSIGGLIGGGCSSSNLLTDIDEICYLPRALDIGAGVSPNGFYREHRGPISTWRVLLNEPYSLPEVGLGYLAYLLHSPPLCFGLALDLFAAAIVYFILTLCFRVFTPGTFSAELACGAFLLFPWSFSLDQYFETKFPSLPFLVSSKIYGTSGLPVLRSISTQISYIFYALFLLFLARAYLDQTEKRREWILSGAFSGALVHVYFFGWGAAIAVAAILLVAVILFHRRAPSFSPKRLIRGMAAFGFAHFLVALPGVYVTLFGQGLQRPTRTPELRHYWYFSLEAMVMLLMFTLPLLSRALTGDRRIQLLVTIGWVTLAAQFALMNLQPVISVFLTPFRFVQLYLQPMMSGIIVLLITSHLIYSRGKIRFVQICAGVIVTAFSVMQVKYLVNHATTSLSEAEMDEMAGAITTHTPPNAVIAVMSAIQFYRKPPPNYSWRAAPNIISATTGRPILHQHWVLPAGIDDSETLGRELLTAFLFSGKTQLFFPCVEVPIDFPGDSFELTWTGHLVARREMCRRHPDLGSGNVDICDLLRRYSVDFALVEAAFVTQFPPPVLEGMFREVWKSANREVRLYSFDRTRAIQSLCGTTLKTTEKRHEEPPAL